MVLTARSNLGSLDASPSTMVVRKAKGHDLLHKIEENPKQPRLIHRNSHLLSSFPANLPPKLVQVIATFFGGPRALFPAIGLQKGLRAHKVVLGVPVCKRYRSLFL